MAEFAGPPSSWYDPPEPKPHGFGCRSCEWLGCGRCHVFDPERAKEKSCQLCVDIADQISGAAAEETRRQDLLPIQPGAGFPTRSEG